MEKMELMDMVPGQLCRRRQRIRMCFKAVGFLITTY